MYTKNFPGTGLRNSVRAGRFAEYAIAALLWGIIFTGGQPGAGRPSGQGQTTGGIPVSAMCMSTERAPYRLFSEKWQSQKQKYAKAGRGELKKKVSPGIFTLLMGLAGAGVMGIFIFLGLASLGYLGLIIGPAVGVVAWTVALFLIFRRRYPDMPKRKRLGRVLLAWLITALLLLIFLASVDIVGY